MEAFMKKMSTKYLIRVSISVILLILLDQLTKIWAVVRLEGSAGDFTDPWSI